MSQRVIIIDDDDLSFDVRHVRHVRTIRSYRPDSTFRITLD